MTWVGWPQAADRSERSGPAQRQFHRLRPEGEDRRFGLDPHQVARIGPPADHAARARRRPARRSASTRVTRASSARTESRRGPGQHHEVRARPCARRPGSRKASSAEWGLSHQWSRPMTGGAGERGPVEGAPQPGGPGHGLGADGGPAGRREPVDPAVELRDRRAAVAHQAGGFGQPVPHGVERRAAPPRQPAGAPRPRRWTRRAVRADQANGSRCVRIRRASPPSAVRTSWSVTRNRTGAGAPDRQAGQLRLGVVEGGPPGRARRPAGRAPPARP